jgi:hypothetical protein
VDAPQQPLWKCWACQAVGTTVQTHTKEGTERVRVTITERPTECCLCGFHTTHPLPMHPLYDFYGLKGRPVLLESSSSSTKKTPHRTAWVHTLCAMVINSTPMTAGCVYGVDREGSYQGEDDDDDDSDSDDVSINSELVKSTPDDIEDIHHFVYNMKKKGKPPDDYTKAIHAARALKCIYCGSNDRRGMSLRIPLQCCANEEYEPVDFQGSHEELGNDSCYQSMHVGCAMYFASNATATNTTWPSYRRVFFFPGTPTDDDDVYPDPVVGVYCDTHAQDLIKTKCIKSTTLHFPTRAQTAAAQPRALSGTKRTLASRTESERPAIRGSANSASLTTGQSSTMPDLSPRRPKAIVSAARSRSATSNVASHTTAINSNIHSEIIKTMVQDVRGVLQDVTDVKQRMSMRKKRQHYWQANSGLSADKFPMVWAQVISQLRVSPSSSSSSSSSKLISSNQRVIQKATSTLASPRKRSISMNTNEKIADGANQNNNNSSPNEHSKSNESANGLSGAKSGLEDHGHSTSQTKSKASVQKRFDLEKSLAKVPASDAKIYRAIVQEVRPLLSAICQDISLSHQSPCLNSQECVDFSEKSCANRLRL